MAPTRAVEARVAKLIARASAASGGADQSDSADTSSGGA